MAVAPKPFLAPSDSSRRAASTSAFPSTLPPRHPIACEESTSLQLRQPLITAADYSDRMRLLSHVTYLTGQLQRAELLLRGAQPDPALMAGFDPHIAQAQIDRLDAALAQVSLMREAELQHSRTMETELQHLREEREDLIARLDDAEERVASIEEERRALRETHEREELEVQRLRETEAVSTRRIAAMEELRDDGGKFHGVHVVVASPLSRAAQKIQDEEQLQRLTLLLEMVMEPISMAMDAGIVWITETEQQRIMIYNQKTNNTTSSTNGSCGSEQSVLEQLRRTRQLLREEQKRTQDMAREHCAQLKDVHNQMLRERHQLEESLIAEVEERMRNAFREGRICEKRIAEERRKQRASERSRTAANGSTINGQTNSAMRTSTNSSYNSSQKISDSEQKNNAKQKENSETM